MRRGLSLIGLAALAACEDPQPLFRAICNDGTRIAGARDIAESRCARRGGVRSLAPLEMDDQPRPPNAQDSVTAS